jgi:O-antigen ligase/polysaccharide polymerase Wzy-like membrane protein
MTSIAPGAAVTRAAPGDRVRRLPIAIVVAGLLVLIATVPLGLKAVVGGSLVLLVAAVVALLEAREPFVTWTNALALLFLVFWLIPMKTYDLPVTLPFQLEPYRLYVLVLLVVWVGALLLNRSRVSAAGFGAPVALLFFTVLISLTVNYHELADLSGSGNEVVKPLMFFMAFLLVFLLVASTTRDLEAVDRLVRVLVAGGAVVGVAAIYEASTRYNFFDNLDQWIPVLEKNQRELDSARGGRLRVYASAQHPIALGCALMMMVPLSIYLAEQARSAWRRRGWLAAGIVLATGAFTTISRTVIVMGLVMLVAWLILRRRQIQRFWKLIPLLPVVVHFVAPGALGGIWKAFFPKQGFVSSFGTGREGQAGSGRVADLSAAQSLWEQSPLVGNGPGSLGLVPEQAARLLERGLEPVTTAPNLIFDNQYLAMLVEFGVIGVIALAWLSWGAVFKMGKVARRNHDAPGDLIAVCTVACAGFSAAMFLFDAIAFIQVTLVFFVLAALGLRVREIVLERERATRPATAPGPVPPS